MKKSFWISNPVILTTMLLVLSGCVTNPTYIDEANPTANKNSGINTSPVHYRVDQRFKNDPPKCIAVLPLTTSIEAGKDKASAQKKEALILTSEKLEKIRKILYSHLAPLPYKDMELAEIDAVLAKKSTNKYDRLALGRALGCSGLLIGEVTVYDSSFLGIYSQSSIGAKLKLINSQDGSVMWEGRHVASSHAGGIPISPVDIAMGVFYASENVSDEQLVRVTDDLFRRLLTTWVQEPSFAPRTMLAGQEGYPFSVTSQKLVLRTGPGKTYSAKSMLYRNDKLTLLSNSNSKRPWAQVKLDDGRSGYVYKKYIQQVGGISLTSE